MSTFSETVEAISQNIDRRDERIQQLEACLTDMVNEMRAIMSDSEGAYPDAYASCIDCTRGAMPERVKKDPCPYHAAKRLLGQL